MVSFAVVIIVVIIILLVRVQVSPEAAAAAAASTTYSVFLKEQARKNQQLVSSVEEKLAQLVAEVTKNDGKKKKSHSFPPMKSYQVFYSRFFTRDLLVFDSYLGN